MTSPANFDRVRCLRAFEEYERSGAELETPLAELEQMTDETLAAYSKGLLVAFLAVGGVGASEPLRPPVAAFASELGAALGGDS